MCKILLLVTHHNWCINTFKTESKRRTIERTIENTSKQAGLITYAYIKQHILHKNVRFTQYQVIHLGEEKCSRVFLWHLLYQTCMFWHDNDYTARSRTIPAMHKTTQMQKSWEKLFKLKLLLFKLLKVNTYKAQQSTRISKSNNLENLPGT